jgi:hypothetical protein
MSTVTEIEDALQKLPVTEARKVSEWLAEYLDRSEAIEGIQRGLNSANLGEGEPAEKVFARLRTKHGISAE